MNKETRGLIFWLFMVVFTTYMYDTLTAKTSTANNIVEYLFWITSMIGSLFMAYLKTN